MARKVRIVDRVPKVTEFQAGDLARNKVNGWLGKVRVVECGICSTPYEGGNPTCPHREYPSVCLTIEQAGTLKPWCLPENFERTVIGPSVWDWIRRPAV